MCQFSITFSGDPESLVSRAKHAIEESGGSLMGDVTEGSFRAKTPIGSIQGSYAIAGQQIVLAITKKPFLLSCSKIERELTSVMR